MLTSVNIGPCVPAYSEALQSQNGGFMGHGLQRLLVLADASPQFAQRMDFACRLASRYGASITALYASSSIVEAVALARDAEDGAAAKLHRVQDAGWVRARSMFEQCKPPGLTVTWAEIHEPALAPAFAEQALYADLLILGQHAAGEAHAARLPSDFPETVIALSGRPATVLPYTSARPGLPAQVVIAWKPNRATAHAVAAALPVLRHARLVTVLSWGTAGVTADTGLTIISYLRDHGVEAHWHRENLEPENLGELLLSRAFDLQADLLVMGCYGRPRAHEWLLGGTSRSVLEHMTLPVFMAH